MSRHRFTKANVSETSELIYRYLSDFVQTHGFSPSVRDVCEGTGIRSTSTIHAHLKRLRDAGRIDMEPGKRRALAITALEGQRVDHIPLVGTVTAGQPILAVENIEDYLPVAASFYPSHASMFALKVRGDSMIEAGILDGDVVFVKKQSVANVGDMIVALIDDEATVKTLGRINGRAVLHPENPKYGDIPFDHDGCRILGVVKSVWRPHV